MNIVFAGDRDISVRVLQFIRSQEIEPLALLVSSQKKASHAEELIALCPHLSEQDIFRGTAFRHADGLDRLRALQPDYILGIHFPYIVPIEVLEIPRVGVLNLHPAYLPYNRGWHTPSWAILDETPYGATLHFMDEDVDTGAIVHQKEVEILPGDTADSLYKKVKELEYEVFVEAWEMLMSGDLLKKRQDVSQGTSHKAQDLFVPEIQRIDLQESVCAGALLNTLRALTTSRWDEAAYYEVDGKRYRVRVEITEG